MSESYGDCRPPVPAAAETPPDTGDLTPIQKQVLDCARCVLGQIVEHNASLPEGAPQEPMVVAAAPIRHCLNRSAGVRYALQARLIHDGYLHEPENLSGQSLLHGRGQAVMRPTEKLLALGPRTPPSDCPRWLTQKNTRKAFIMTDQQRRAARCALCLEMRQPTPDTAHQLQGGLIARCSGVGEDMAPHFLSDALVSSRGLAEAGPRIPSRAQTYRLTPDGIAELSEQLLDDDMRATIAECHVGEPYTEFLEAPTGPKEFQVISGSELTRNAQILRCAACLIGQQLAAAEAGSKQVPSSYLTTIDIGLVRSCIQTKGGQLPQVDALRSLVKQALFTEVSRDEYPDYWRKKAVLFAPTKHFTSNVVYERQADCGLDPSAVRKYFQEKPPAPPKSTKPRTSPQPKAASLPKRPPKPEPRPTRIPRLKTPQPPQPPKEPRNAPERVVKVKKKRVRKKAPVQVSFSRDDWYEQNGLQPPEKIECPPVLIPHFRRLGRMLGVPTDRAVTVYRDLTAHTPESLSNLISYLQNWDGEEPPGPRQVAAWIARNPAPSSD